MPADVVGVGVGGLEEKGGGMAVYSKERVVPKRFQIALCVSEKVAVAGPVGNTAARLMQLSVDPLQILCSLVSGGRLQRGWVRSPGPPRRPSPR